MSFPVYSTVIFSGEVTTPGYDEAYLVPEGYTWVIRDVDVYVNAGVAAGEIYFLDAFTAYPWWFIPGPNVAGEYYYSWRGRQVFPYVEGDFNGIKLLTTTGTNTWYVRISGYQLTQA